MKSIFFFFLVALQFFIGYTSVLASPVIIAKEEDVTTLAKRDPNSPFESINRRDANEESQHVNLVKRAGSHRHHRRKHHGHRGRHSKSKGSTMAAAPQAMGGDASAGGMAAGAPDMSAAAAGGGGEMAVSQ